MKHNRHLTNWQCILFSFIDEETAVWRGERIAQVTELSWDLSSILLILECLLLPLHHMAWAPERSSMENSDAGATHRPGALPGSFSTAGRDGPRLYTRKLRLARVTNCTSSKGSSPPRRADFNDFLMLLLQTFLTLSQIQR